MPDTNHNDVAYSITKFVYNRIPFLVESEANQNLISNYIVEAANEAQSCFNVPANSVAVESAYTAFQKSILGDMVAVGILKRIVAENSQNASIGAGAEAATYLKKAKAGSAEAEFEQVDIDKTMNKEALVMKAQGFIDLYVGDITRKYGQLGCVYDAGGVQPPLGFIVRTYG
jgi:hypothetical protein